MKIEKIIKSIINILVVVLLVLIIFPSIRVYADTRTKLATPTNLHWVEGKTLTLAWDAVENATQYDIEIYQEDGTHIVGTGTGSGDETSMDLACVLAGFFGEYTGNVYATVSAGVFSEDENIYMRYRHSDASQPSQIKYFSVGGRTKLATPTNLHWVEGKMLTLAWDAIENATQYDIEIYQEDGTHIVGTGTGSGDETSMDLACVLAGFFGEYTGNVYATVSAGVFSEDENIYMRYRHSDASQPSQIKYFSVGGRTKLATPTNLHWVEGKMLTLAWDAIENATQYDIEIYQEDGTHIVGTGTGSGDETSMDLAGVLAGFFGEYIGNVYATVKAQVFSEDENIYMRYRHSDASQPSVVKWYVLPIVVNASNGVEFVSSEELLEVLINSMSDEMKATLAGRRPTFELCMTNIASSNEETETISSYANSMGYNVGNYFDISLLVKIDGQNIGNISTTVGAIPMTVAVPGSIQKEGRTFFVLRNHNGVISEVGRGTGTQIPIDTNEFSTYAIVYTDSLAYVGTVNEANNDYLIELEERIKEAIEEGGEHIIDWNKGNALPLSILQDLKANPKITLNFSYKYEGKEYKVIISGNNVILDNSIPWYGPLWLAAHYPSKVSGSVTTSTHSSASGGIYIVKSGDTMWAISRKVGKSLAQLKSSNPHIKDINKIYVGEQIKY